VPDSATIHLIDEVLTLLFWIATNRR
jgi:hypothetical protein